MCGEIMTGTAFLKRLLFQLDFLTEEEKQTVARFYEKKLSDVVTLTEEELIVKSFGSPEHIAQRLKQSYHLLHQNNQAAAPSEPTQSTDSSEKTGTSSIDEHDQTRIETIQTASEEDTGSPSDDDLIFTKPVAQGESAEVIHSMEKSEVKPIYGEKVVIEDRQTPIEEIVLEPLDQENGLSAEEIDKAKADTLQKAKTYDEEVFAEPEEKAEKVLDEAKALDHDPLVLPTVVDAIPATEEENLSEDAPQSDEVSELEEDTTAKEPEHKKEYVGLFNRLFPAEKHSPAAKKGATVFLSIPLLPFLFIFLSVGALAYLISTIVIVLVSVLVFILMVGLIVAGIIELVYGFTLLFDSVAIGLIEIGIGTILFGVVTASAAIIYEFLFSIVPKTLKCITQYFLKYLKTMIAFVYGGKV